MTHRNSFHHSKFRVDAPNVHCRMSAKIGTLYPFLVKVTMKRPFKTISCRRTRNTNLGEVDVDEADAVTLQDLIPGPESDLPGQADLLRGLDEHAWPAGRALTDAAGERGRVSEGLYRCCRRGRKGN